MRLVAEHLVGLGHKRIGCIVPDPDLMFARYRLAGLREGLEEHGITLADSCIRIGDLTQRGGFEKAGELLDLPNRPSAIAACNDLMAFGAMSAAQERGLVVGKDIAITGFDDTPMAELSHPPLTTVRQPIYKIGGMVCEMLLQSIRGESLEQEQVMLQPSLVVRQSCGEKIN
jgi:LacI family transcriptional regulator